ADAVDTAGGPDVEAVGAGGAADAVAVEVAEDGGRIHGAVGGDAADDAAEAERAGRGDVGRAERGVVAGQQEEASGGGGAAQTFRRADAAGRQRLLGAAVGRGQGDRLNQEAGGRVFVQKYGGRRTRQRCRAGADAVNDEVARREGGEQLPGFQGFDGQPRFRATRPLRATTKLPVHDGSLLSDSTVNAPSGWTRRSGPPRTTRRVTKRRTRAGTMDAVRRQTAVG